MTRAKIAQSISVSLIISAAILLFLIRLTTWWDFLALWHQLHWGWVAVSGLLYCTEVVLSGIRMSALFATERPPIVLTILVSNIHNCANKVMPARIGELAFPLLMNCYAGLNSKRAFSILILARLADLYMVLITFSITYILQQDLLSDWGFHWLPVALAWLVLLLVSSLLVRNDFWTRWLSRSEQVSRRWPLDQVRQFLSSLWHDLHAALRVGIRAGMLGYVGLYSLLIWSSIYLVFIALGRAMGLRLALGQFLIGATAAILGTMLPVGGMGHFGGLEAGWTLGLLAVGVPSSKAASSAIVISVMTTLFALSIALVSLTVLKLHSWQVSKHLTRYPE